MTALPLAGFELSVNAAPDRIINEVALYANKTGFAMRADPLVSSNKGSMFNITLFRDDLLVTVTTPFKPSEVSVGVLPPCSCEAKYRPNLEAHAKEVASDLRSLLGAIPHRR